VKKRYAAPQKYRHDRELELIDLPGFHEGSKQDAAAKQPDGPA
jgi:predicted GTPase